MVSSRKRDPSSKKVSKLYVEPAELARKLIKELEGTKSSGGGQTWVRDQYTVFLCREDFARLRSHLDDLVHKLESHMERHVQSKRYATDGAITVELTMDPDLKPGYFGVLAEREDRSAVGSRAGAPPTEGKSVWDVPEDVDHDAFAESPVRGGPRAPGVAARPGSELPPVPVVPPVPPVQAPPLPGAPAMGGPAAGATAPPLPDTPPKLGPSYGSTPSAPRDAVSPAQESAPVASPQPPQQPPQQAPEQVPPERPQQPSAAPPVQSSVAPAAQPQAAAAGEPLVLKVNGQERLFPKGKAVVGRSRDADLQIDSADVSRRHAMIYCSEGSVVVKDLGSTNGTMVNGYPIDSTVVRPSDVIRIGNAHITAAPK